MNKILTAAAATALLMGTNLAMAGESSAGAGASVSTSPAVQSNTSVKVNRSHHRTRASVRSRETTGYGIGPENNAAAKGSVLPGKDRLNSKAYLQTH